MKTFAVIFGALALSAAAYGQMYKWVDKEGKTHYTDIPPPSDARSVTPVPAARAREAPAKSIAEPAGFTDRPVGQPVGAQGSFRPAEELALRTVCVIYLLETLTCQLSLQRYCPVDELVKGIGGNPTNAMARDPRNDPNYDYRVEFRSDDVLISAIPKMPGLTGFFSNSNSGMRYNPNGAAGKDDKKIVGPTNCPGRK
jgi:Domain of unknown function (DUF4124)